MIAIRQPRRWPDWINWLKSHSLEPIESLPLLTIVLLLTTAPDQWYLRGPLTALCALAVVYRRWLSSAPFWYVAATLLGTTIYLNWESSDNHKYLMAYWCLTLCAAFSLPQQQQAAALSLSSRWLIGLCMLLAIAWKLAMPDYRSGAFFEFTLLADERFASFAAVVANISLKTLGENRHLIELLHAGHLHGAAANSVVLEGSTLIAPLAFFMTWWTVAIEGALAALFLAPDRPRLAVARNAALLLFLASTYLLAPVSGFGWVLVLLGLAQCDDKNRAFRPFYVAALVLIQIYTLPLAAVWERLVAR